MACDIELVDRDSTLSGGDARHFTVERQPERRRGCQSTFIPRACDRDSGDRNHELTMVLVELGRLGRGGRIDFDASWQRHTSSQCQPVEGKWVDRWTTSQRRAVAVVV